MIYQRTLAIGRRLTSLVEMIRTGRYSTRALAVALGVSVPTVSRCLAALRRHGYRIEPRREGRGWYYVLVQEPDGVPVVNR